MPQAAGPRDVAIIMVSARDSETDKVVGLEIGADDYVTKPFSHRELVARIRAILRRGHDTTLIPEVVEMDGVRIDVERHQVLVDGQEVRLALREFELLELLLRNAGRVMTRGQIIDRIWAATTSATPKPSMSTSNASATRSNANRQSRPG